MESHITQDYLQFLYWFYANDNKNFLTAFKQGMQNVKELCLDDESRDNWKQFEEKCKDETYLRDSFFPLKNNASHLLTSLESKTPHELLSNLLELDLKSLSSRTNDIQQKYKILVTQLIGNDVEQFKLFEKTIKRDALYDYLHFQTYIGKLKNKEIKEKLSNKTENLSLLQKFNIKSSKDTQNIIKMYIKLLGYNEETVSLILKRFCIEIKQNYDVALFLKKLIKDDFKDLMNYTKEKPIEYTKNVKAYVVNLNVKWLMEEFNLNNSQAINAKDSFKLRIKSYAIKHLNMEDDDIYITNPRNEVIFFIEDNKYQETVKKIDELMSFSRNIIEKIIDNQLGFSSMNEYIKMLIEEKHINNIEIKDQLHKKIKL